MKIYNNVQYRPNFTGNFVENRCMKLAVDRSSYITRGAFENLCERMKNTPDGYLFELISEEVESTIDKLGRKKDVFLYFTLKISNKNKKEEKRIIYNTNNRRIFFGKTEEDCYSGVLRQVNRILKTFYNKPLEQIKKEKSANSADSSLRFSALIEDFGLFPEEAEIKKHDDLQRFDAFFRDNENFDRKHDMREQLNSPYDEDDVELSDSIKTHMFDVLF